MATVGVDDNSLQANSQPKTVGLDRTSGAEFAFINWNRRIPPKTAAWLLLARTASRCEGLIFYRCGYFSFLLLFFPTPNLRGHWTDLNQTGTHIHLWLLFKKIGPNSPGHLPTTGWGKNRFLGLTLNFDRTYLCNGTWYQQLERSLSIYRDSPIHASKFGELWSTNGWERLVRFCPPPKFSHWETATLTSWTLYNRQHANFVTCYVVARAYSL